MSVTLSELSEHLGTELVGEGSRAIESVAPLHDASPGQVSFLANPKYRGLLRSTRASAVIVGPSDREVARAEGLELLVSPNPYLAFARAVALLHPSAGEGEGIDPGAHIDPSAELEEGVRALAGSFVGEGARVGRGTVLHPGAYVGRNATVGAECVLYPNVVVQEGCRLGDRVILQPSCVIGSDGFGYARDGSRHVKIPQVGIVVLEDGVEVGAGTTIDRAALGETRIGRGTKIDNLVQIAHNVVLGSDCLVIAQVGISGSTRIGSRVILAGQAGVVGHVTIGDGAIIGARTGIGSDVEPGAVLSGSPAMPHRESLKAQAIVRKLPELRSQLRALEQRLERLERTGDAPEERR
ncbi:MAG: UDP-3-O-(3-hydroxymyristoyl)glucosamine N-acyltransferase [Deltaproteobacteria bacterium]|nr:UDP-3-O-(3-hydroxymyristoyl)glucosamine N-acyltransferase [Deltaproteobacteria bacterium]